MNKEFNNETWKDVLSVFEKELKQAGLNYKFKVKIYTGDAEFSKNSTLQIFKKGDDGIDWGVAQMALGFAHERLIQDEKIFLERIIGILKSTYDLDDKNI